MRFFYRSYILFAAWFSLLLLMGYGKTGAQAPSPVACYNFSGNLQEAGGGPMMTPINSAQIFSSGPSACGTDSFYIWTLGAGLNLSIGTLFPKDHYTLELLFKFTSSPYPRSWQRIVDFKNNTVDLGFYSYGSPGSYNLQMYTQNTGTTNMAIPDTWLHVFLTRDAASDTMYAYINDSLQITVNDAGQAGVFTNSLILFKDDIAVSGEESAGLIDYLRIYNRPLTRAEITEILASARPTVGISGNLAVCTGDSTLLSATGATNYLWNNGATTSSIYVKPSATTAYSVAGYNYLFCNRSCMSYDTVTVTTGSTTGVTAGPDTTVCEGSFVQLHSTGTGTVAWSPTTNLSDPNSPDPFSMPLTTTTYTVTVTSGNCTGSATVTLNVLPTPPTPIITQSADTLYCSIHPSYVSYQWYNDSTLLVGATNSYYVFPKGGNYNVQVRNSDGCSIAVGTNIVGLSPPDDPAASGILIYPNPAGVQLTVTVNHPSKATGIRLSIYTAQGQRLYNAFHTFTASAPGITLDVSGFAHGIYIVEIQAANTVNRQRLIKR